MPVSSLPSDQKVTPIEFYVVKVFGSHRRVERTVKILRDLRATDQQTACVCQDDLMREMLHELGIPCLSFHEQIDQETERQAWSQAIRLKNEMFSQISSPPFRVGDYECSECILGIDADRFAFLTEVVLLRNKLFQRGFKRVIVLLPETHFWLLPDVQQDFYRVVASRSRTETFKLPLRRLFPYLFPFFSLSFFLYFPLLFVPLRYSGAVVYRLRTEIEQHLSMGRKEGLRVLIVTSDVMEFPSYYSRPAATIAAACVEHGHKPLIATNLFVAPGQFLDRGFKASRHTGLALLRIGTVWSEVLRVRSVLSRAREPTDKVLGDLWDLAHRIAKEEATGRALLAASGILFFHKLFEQFSPHVLLTISDGSSLAIAAIAVARKKGIPSLTTLAGQIFDHPQYGFLNADVIAVNDDSAREVFLKRGISPQRVVVTGMAHYDETCRMAESLRQSRKTTEPGVVVFATENLPLAETFRMISPVAEATLAILGARMVIRPHPRENPSVYKEFVKKFASNRVVVDSTTPLLELLSTAAVCVTGFSNVALEAMMLDRPVICVNLSGEPDKLAYVQERAALGVYDASEAFSALDKALHDQEVRAALAKGRKSYLERHFCGADGKASLRIVKLLEKLAERRASHQAPMK